MLKLVYDNTNQRADLDRHTGQNLIEGDDLTTAVLISLFTERRAKPSEAPDPKALGGYWADSVTGESWGSLLWTLRGAKATQSNITLAKSYIQDALVWLLDDKIATSVEVITRRGSTTSSLWYEIQITRKDGSVWAGSWERQFNEL